MKDSKKKQWTSAEKLRIVLAGMQPETNVSELCRREGVSPTQYYTWRDRLLNSAATVFDRPAEGPTQAEERAQAELQRLKEVIVEITTENLELKKTR